MARRARKSGGSRPAARWVAWSPAMAEVFTLGGELSGWNPPSQVRVSPGRHRMTLSARFTDAGREMTARIRCVRDGADEWFVTSEELSIPLDVRRSGAGA